MGKYREIIESRDAISGQFDSTHSDSGSKEYGIWGNMLYRCHTESSSHYSNYGGRGVKVGSDWFDYENFIKDMGRAPSLEHSLDRINNDGDYTKENCRWATKKQQSRNRRNSIIVTVYGVDLQVNDYCEKYNKSVHTIRNRIKRGWPMSKIINTPTKGYFHADN